MVNDELATLYFTREELLTLMHAVRSALNSGGLGPSSWPMLNALDTALTETIWGMEHPRVTPARNEERP